MPDTTETLTPGQKAAQTRKAKNPEAYMTAASAISEMMIDALANKFGDSLTDAAIHRAVEKVAAKQLESHRKIEVSTLKGSHIVEGLTHSQLPSLMIAVAAGVPVMLVGPAGSGKTQAAAQVAEALAVPFTAQSVCAQTTASLLLGYMDAAGNYIRSLFRDCYENGGLYLLDEIDAGNANVLAVLNSALSNGHCAFPDMMVKRHDNFRCIASANTWGNGRTIEYVGRQPIDAATLDRFAQMRWDYDEILERNAAGNDEWTSYVQKTRAEVARRSIKHLITPRASILGARLLSAGMKKSEVEDLMLWKGLDDDTSKAIKEAVKN